MAREIRDREDLLRDAVALVPRIQLRSADNNDNDEIGANVFAGFRDDCLSLYFNDEPVLHFNSSGELRHAYYDGCLVKAERGRLVALRRDQSAEKSDLVRIEWDAVRTREFLSDVERRLEQLRAVLTAAEYDVVGQVPLDGDALSRLCEWLARREPITIAASPRVQ